MQGNGDGTGNVFLTAGTQIGCYSHWVSATGFWLPVDMSQASTVWYWSNHWDRRIGTWRYEVCEVNWYHWLKSGEYGTDGLEGLDLINLGSTGVAGQDIVTAAFGLKAKPDEHIEIGVAWELPVMKERDIIDNRLTVDCILRY